MKIIPISQSTYFLTALVLTVVIHTDPFLNIWWIIFSHNILVGFNVCYYDVHAFNRSTFSFDDNFIRILVGLNYWTWKWCNNLKSSFWLQSIRLIQHKWKSFFFNYEFDFPLVPFVPPLNASPRRELGHWTSSTKFCIRVNILLNNVMADE